jgi:hypothetical protein
MYLVSFLSYGNDGNEIFTEYEKAVDFIKGNLNDSEYSDFGLWVKHPVTVTIEI